MLFLDKMYPAPFGPVPLRGATLKKSGEGITCYSPRVEGHYVPFPTQPDTNGSDEMSYKKSL